MRQPIAAIAMTAILAVSLGTPRSALAGDGPGSAELVAELEATEVAFAQTLADRDHEAFASFLAEETVFYTSGSEFRGRETVAAAWKPFFEGPAAPFSWNPDTATVLDSGTLGFTSGPIFAPDGKRVGTFNSVWRREADGSWKVIFDRGCPACDCPPNPGASD